jgi:hypothetical protein
MRLANDETAISLGSETIHLRPTLRAAFRLERTYAGFQNLSQAIALGHVSAFVAVIRQASADPSAVDRYLAYAGEHAMLVSVMELREPLLKFILILAGADDNSSSKLTSSPISFEEYFTKLFRIATGWLGWSSEQAWNATPAEIIEAHRGRTEMLSAIFGGGNASDDNTITDIGSARDRLNALGNQSVTSMSEVPLC